MQVKHWLLLHVSQFLYLFSHLIKLDGSEGSCIYLLYKALLLKQLDLFPLIKVNPPLQDEQWVKLHESQLEYLFSHLM